MERRDFLKLATGSLTSAILLPTFPENANSVTTRNPILNLPSSDTPRMAWTIDDGCNQKSIERYIQFAVDNDLRLTFFIYSAMAPWKNVVKLLRPLVETGQIQLANHTHTHPDLTKLSYSEVQDELMNCHRFINKNYGVDARPYFRAPYGAFNKTVIKAAAEVGYTMPMFWSGSLADAQTLQDGRLLYHANISIQDRGILLAHANNLVSSNHFDRMLKMVTDRNLSLVTLTDAFGV